MRQTPAYKSAASLQLISVRIVNVEDTEFYELDNIEPNDDLINESLSKKIE